MVEALPSDVSIVGTVLAVAVVILILSGLALYIAFRVRDTLHDEKGGGAKAAKVAFLIGLLFLSGGVFYFFASGLNPGATQSTSTGTSSLTSSTMPSTSATSSSQTSTTQTTSSITSASTTSSTSTTSGASVSMPTPQCPGQVLAGATLQCTIYIYNTGSSNLTSATLTASVDLYQFAFVNCSESVNGGASTQVPVTSHTVSVGSIPPGTTVLTLTLQAPSSAGQYNDNVLTLAAPGLSQPISDTFSMQVTH